MQNWRWDKCSIVIDRLLALGFGSGFASGFGSGFASGCGSGFASLFVVVLFGVFCFCFVGFLKIQEFFVLYSLIS